MPKASEPNSTAGSWGSGPAGSTKMFLPLGSGTDTKHEASSRSPSMAEVRPFSVSAECSSSPSIGRRRSAETTTTRNPLSASTAARLAVTVVLPSSPTELVTRMVRFSLPRLEKRRLVARAWYDSAATDVGATNARSARWNRWVRWRWPSL